jgi:hypothetical protein
MLSGTHHQRQSLFHIFTPNAFPILPTIVSSNLADDLLRVDLQGYEAVCDVSLSPRYAIHDSRNLGFDFAAI